jgi:hypothetical protein
MASTWSSLGIRLMTTGENANAWGDQTNQNWERLEDAADGLATVAVTGATSLTFTAQPTSYADENGRNKVLVFTGTAGGTQAITFPNIEKTYHVLNDSNSTLTLTTGTGAATVSLEAGKDKMIYNDGSDEIHDALANLAITTLDISSTLQVDGAITSSAGATITVADNSDNLTLKSTDADANAGPNLILQRDSGSPADGDAIGRIDFDADNDAGEVTSFFSIRAEIEDASDGSEDGQMKIDQMIAGTAVSALRFKSSETVFNDDSKDVDFRVESNANTHMLFVDGNNDHVNMGTSTAYAGKLNIETTDNSFNLFLVSTDADASAGPNMKFYRNSGSPADNDITGNIHFTGRNDNSQDVDYAHIETLIADASDGTEDGYMNIYVALAGTQARSRIEMDSTEMVINEGGADLDFRVESDGQTHALFVDAGNNVVGIGNSTASSFNSQARNLVVGTGSGAQGLTIYSANDSSGNIFFADGTSGDDPTRAGVTYKHDDNSMLFRINDTNRITIADGGPTTITVADNSDTLKLISTDADASVGPVLHMVRDSASPADGDSLGRIHFSGDNDAGEEEIFARIKVAIVDASNGSEDANMRFSRMTGGGDQNMLSFETSETVFNDDSKDIDFRVESDGDANALFVDAGNNRVGFFTNSPDNEIDLKRAANAVMKIESTNNGDDAKLLIKKAGSSSRNMVVFQSTNSWHVGHLRNATSTFSIATQDDSGSSNEFRVTTTGVLIAGSLSKGSGSFKIEHPHSSKKDTHNLVHSFLEGPQADLIYRGKVDLVGGSATVNVDTVSGMTDGTFVLLNTDVQCFTSNETGWTAVKGSVSGNTLTITAEDNSCTDTISWMVVGERHDQHMKDTNWTDDDGKVIVEPLKEEDA